MYTHNLSPFLIQFSDNFGIRWYSLVYLLGFLSIYLLLKNKKSEVWIKNWKTEYVDSLVTWTFLGMLIGARLMHVLMELLSNTSIGHYYLTNPLNVFFVWQGGLSFHGALFGMVFAVWKFSKKYKVKFYDIADFLVIPTALFLVFGRIANFINGEMIGTVTNVKWCINYSFAEACRHPTVLYEAVKNIFIFVLLYNLRKLKLPKGTLFWTFITTYGLIRFFLMYLRDEAIVFVGLTLSQVFSGIMFLVGSYFLAKRLIK